MKDQNDTYEDMAKDLSVPVNPGLNHVFQSTFEIVKNIRNTLNVEPSKKIIVVIQHSINDEDFSRTSKL